MSVASEEKLESFSSTQALDDSQKVARAQQKLEHEYTRWDAIKAYPHACIYILIMTWAMITVGFENMASGIVVSIPTFRRDFGYEFEGQYVLEGKWQSAISGGPAGSLVAGCIFGSAIVDYTGRKYLIWAAVSITMAFIGIEFAATTIEVFFAGKFMNAFCLGIIQTVGTSYVAELTPLALRGLSTATINLSFCIGPFVCYLISNLTSTREDRWAYRAIFCSQWAFAGVAMVILAFLPESPYHHVINNNHEKALLALRKIYRNPGVAESQLVIIQATIEEAQTLSSSGSYLELFNKKNLKRTLAATSPFIMQPMSGLAYVGSYQTYYYQLSGFSTQKSFQISCGAQALSVSGTLASFFMIDRFGRRFVVLYGIISLGILNVLTAALGMRKEKSFLTASSAFLTMFNFFYNSGIGPISYVINSEVPTSKLRAKSIALGLSFNNGLLCMWAFVLPYMFNPNEANMGSKINFIFAGCCAVSLIYFYLYIPETAGRSFEEVDEMYMDKVPPRKWKGYQSKASQEGTQVVEEQFKGEMEHVEKVV